MDGNDMLAKWRRDWENADGTIFGAGGEGRGGGGRGGRGGVEIEVDETGIRGGVRQQYIPYLYPQRWASKLFYLRLKEDGRAVCPSPFIRNDYMFKFLQCFLFSCRRNRAHSLVAPFGASEPIKSKKISHYRMVIPTLAIICLFFQLQPLVWGALVSKFGGNYDEMTHFC